MLEPLLAPAVNRLLRRNSWALASLQPHAGKTLAIAAAPLLLRFTIAPAGELEPAKSESPADATITVTPSLLLRLGARDEAAWKEVVVSGDVELAGVVDYLRRHLVWDYEEDLSRIVGDIAAHRMANGFRALDRWGRAAAVDLGRAVAEYAAYENPVIASREALREFVHDVDELRDAAERLEKRVEILKRGHAPS